MFNFESICLLQGDSVQKSEKFLAEDKTVEGDLEESGKIQFCSSARAESGNKGG